MNHPKTAWYLHRGFQGVLGIVLAFIAYVLVPGDTYTQAPVMGAIITLMATWWVFEVIPIPVTSLLPIILMPVFGIAEVDKVSLYYGKPIIFLFLGGFLLAIGLQESGVHKRIALHIVRRIGSQPRHLILGFMLSSALLSMWISNTATVMVMLPVALSVMDSIEHKHGANMHRSIRSFGTALLLCIAYASDIGGMATPVGTPPNLIFMELFKEAAPHAKPIGFASWMAFGVPLSALFLFGGWYMLTRWIYPMENSAMLDGRSEISDQIKSLGPMRADERRSASIFGLAVFLWMFGSDIQLGSFTLHGWRSLTGLSWATDPVVAIFCSSLLFMVPSADRPTERLLSWERGTQLPWGILLLFGGGFAMAAGFSDSGLSELVKDVFINLPEVSVLMLIILICVVITFLTEITSNSAVTTLMLPIFAALSAAKGISPEWLMFPAVLSASCAFMMPIASPTQAIIFGTKYVSIQSMMRAGIWFNLLGIALMSAMFYLALQFWPGIF